MIETTITERDYPRGYSSASEIARRARAPRSDEALARWSASLSARGLSAERVRDDAADHGSLMHAAVRYAFAHEMMPSAQAHARDGVRMLVDRVERNFGDPSAAITSAALCRDYLIDLENAIGLSIVAIEKSIVIDEWQACGTPDAVLSDNETCWIVDWKSADPEKSKRKMFRVEHAVQAGIYARLWEADRGGDCAGISIVYAPRDGSRLRECRIEGRQLRSALHAADRSLWLDRFSRRGQETFCL